MSVIKIAKARMLKATTKPLTLDEAIATAPAIASTAAGPATLGAYRHISSLEILESLLKMDYVITEVAQQRGKSKMEDAAAKHMVRLRPAKLFDPTRTVGDVVPEIIFVNAHNASSKAHFLAGLWRFICANGLMAGQTIGAISVKHTMTAQQAALEAVSGIGTDLLPKIMTAVNKMKTTKIEEDQQLFFATRAITARWGAGAEITTARQVLEPRREEDKGDLVWQVFNRVQENVMQGGFTAANRNVRVRELEQVSHRINVNRAMWDDAVELSARWRRKELA